MRSVSELTDIDIFFYYGQLDLDLEIESDIFNGLIQDKRSLFYNREDGAGVSEYENHPNVLLLEIGVRFEIVEWISYRNQQVGDGTNGSKERRVASSQLAIFTERNGGELDISVFYIPFYNYNNISNVQTGIPL